MFNFQFIILVSQDAMCGRRACGLLVCLCACLFVGVVLLLWVLLLRYRGLVPLVLLIFILEPALRAFVGHLKPVITEGVAPGRALNWVVEPILVVAFFLSLCPSRRAPTL